MSARRDSNGALDKKPAKRRDPVTLESWHALARRPRLPQANRASAAPAAARGRAMMSSHDRIRDALEYIPAGDRDIWLRMGMAVKSELGDEGFDIWDTWSRSGESYDARDAKDVWKGIRANGKVTGGTLFHEAKARGWANGSHSCLSPHEIAQHKRAHAAQEEAEKAREHAEAARKAATIWKTATPVPDDSPYLLRKGVKPVSTLREIPD